jgi:hypothetical protein
MSKDVKNLIEYRINRLQEALEEFMMSNELNERFVFCSRMYDELLRKKEEWNLLSKKKNDIQDK